MNLMTEATGIGPIGIQTRSSTASSLCSAKLSECIFLLLHNNVYSHLDWPQNFHSFTRIVMIQLQKGYIHRFKDTIQFRFTETNNRAMRVWYRIQPGSEQLLRKNPCQDVKTRRGIIEKNRGLLICAAC